MNNTMRLEKLLGDSIKEVVGWGEGESLGGLTLPNESENPLVQSIIDFFFLLVGADVNTASVLNEKVKALVPQLRQTFVDYYANLSIFKIEEIEKQIKTAQSREKRAKHITALFIPEIQESDSDILSKWKLKNVKSNPNPIRPTEVVLQLNALYTFPKNVPADLSDTLKHEWEGLDMDGVPKLADYDHPVSLFEKDEHHELITCLKELNQEMGFEREQGVIPMDYRYPVLISVSVTHKNLDLICGNWIEWLLNKYHFKNLKCFVLTEDKVNHIKASFLKKPVELYTVLGKYASHFNALKYTQLLFEKAYGIRAGFKLDTDEGTRSKDLFAATGKTWLQTMCHELWGGEGVDHSGEKYYLGVNEGEYVNKTDIDALGFAGSLRTPDVSSPSSYCGSEIFFNKAFAHGRCTALYNQYESLNDHISHPVVKGGGYGITNDGLRMAVPFTLSKVGRAEDQQFYFCSLAGGCRGIFNPDLRIAHYKSSGGAAAQAEEKTIATRFVGDMYRLVIFSDIVEILPEMYQHADKTKLKREIDPMPGVFAGKMSVLQAFLNLHYKAYSFCEQGKETLAEVLLTEGVAELVQLVSEIESGTIQKLLFKESEIWESFIKQVDDLEGDAVHQMLNSFEI